MSNSESAGVGTPERIAEDIARYQRCESDAGGAYSYDCTDDKLCDQCFFLAHEIKQALQAQVDASAARIASLESQLAEATRGVECEMIRCPYEQRAEAAEAQVRALTRIAEKWHNRADRGFDPEETPETTAFWNGARSCADELMRALASPPRAESAPTACGLSTEQLHRAVAALDRQADCEKGEHEWGAVQGGVKCRWCRLLVTGAEAEAIWKHEEARAGSAPPPPSESDALRFWTADGQQFSVGLFDLADCHRLGRAWIAGDERRSYSINGADVAPPPPSEETTKVEQVCARCGHYEVTHGSLGDCVGWMPAGAGHHETKCRCTGFVKRVAPPPQET